MPLTRFYPAPDSIFGPFPNCGIPTTASEGAGYDQHIWTDVEKKTMVALVDIQSHRVQDPAMFTGHFKTKLYRTLNAISHGQKGGKQHS